MRESWGEKDDMMLILHSLAHVAFANDEIATTWVAPVDGIKASIAALPGEVGIVVRPVLSCESLLTFHEICHFAFDELSVTLDRTESGSCSYASDEGGHSQDEVVEYNHVEQTAVLAMS